MEEIWKDIPDYNGYQVSNLGRVKTLDRTVIYSNGLKVKYKGKILKEFNHKHNYSCVNLWKNNKAKTFLIHRLVAQAFIPNPNYYNEINHIDNNRKNNVVSNLEWCTHKENENHKWNTGNGVSPFLKYSKTVFCFNFKTKEIIKYDSMIKCCKAENISIHNLKKHINNNDKINNKMYFNDITKVLFIERIEKGVE